MPRILRWEDVELEYFLIWKRWRVGEYKRGSWEEGGDRREEMEHEEEATGEKREEEIQEKKGDTIQDEL